MLEAHSHFTFGSGCLAPAELARRLAEAGWTAAALCDDDGLHGFVDFQRGAREHGLKPILALRLPALGGLVVVARGEAGRRELNRLVTLRHLGPGWERRLPVPRRSHEALARQAAARDPSERNPAERNPAERNPAERDPGADAAPPRKGPPAAATRAALLEAVAVLEDCHVLLPGRAALAALEEEDRLRRLPAGRVHAALSPLGDRRELSAFWTALRARGLPVVAHLPAHYAAPGDLGWHQRLRAIAGNTSLERLVASGSFEAQAWIRSPDDWRVLFARLPEALRNLEALHADCELAAETGRLHLPRLEGARSADDDARLAALCRVALPRRYPAPGRWRRRGPRGPGSVGITPLAEAEARLARELETIAALGFSGYFLVVREIVEFARREGLPSIGRGSAANSLVAYLLDFTEVDPIRHSLSFERFLNPWRRSPPDIDLDFSWTDRDRVLAWVSERFGPERTAMICTTVTFGPRGALRELAKIEGIGGAELERLTKTFPRGVHDWEEELRERPERHGLDAAAEPLASLLPWVGKLVGAPRHLGVHAGGVVIAPGPIVDHLPLERAGKGWTVTQLDMHPVEELGLLKIDLLAQRGLGVHADLDRQLAARRRAALADGAEPPDAPPESVYELERDPATASLLREGRTMGCFYVESPGMQALLRKLRCASFEDLVAASSIIRPGVSESGMMQAYVERHNRCAALPPGAPSPVEYAHPVLEELLEDTYGVMVYQEDVMRVVSGLAGLSLAEGDLLRRAMTGKGASRAELLAMRERFLAGCASKGVGEEIALEVWRQIASFAGYAFCKAHSASFAVLSYRVAWFKAHWPAEFVAAVLSNQGGFFSSAAYVQEARRLGLAIRPPCVVHGGAGYAGAGRELRVGLQQVGGLGHRTLRRLLAERRRRPFSGFDDFRRRSGADAAELEALVGAGALDALAGDGDPCERRPALLWRLRLLGGARGAAESPGPSLFDELPEERPVAVGRWSRIETWLRERAALGFGVSRHPMELFDFGDLEQRCLPATELVHHEGQRVELLGWKFAHKTISTRRSKERMAFLSLEDASGTCEAVLFPAVWERHALLCRAPGPFWLRGTVEMEAGVPMLQVETMARAGTLSERKARTAG